MTFTIPKEDKEKLMNKMIKLIKAEVKHTDAKGTELNDVLYSACKNTTLDLYNFMLEHADVDSDVDSYEDVTPDIY